MLPTIQAEDGAVIPDGERGWLTCRQCGKHLYPQLEASLDQDWVEWRARCCGDQYTLIPFALEMQIYEGIDADIHGNG